MARNKGFDPEDALQAATNVFWRLGYQNTSLDALMKEMGIARQSLYDTFGDKRSLYFQALRSYRDGNHAMMRDLFANGRSVREGFSTLLYGLSRETREEHQRGCLLLSANMEHAASDKEVAAFLRANQRTVEEIFAGAFRQAQNRGEIPADKDPVALAEFFLATIQGMRALARLNHNRKALENIAGVALQSLD